MLCYFFITRATLKGTGIVMASNIVKYRSSLDIYQISVHIQCQILCEQCTCITI